MPSPTSRTWPTSLVANCPLKSSISFCRTEAISSALNFMETPLLDALAQLRDAGRQRAIVNGVGNPDHNSANQRRIDLGLENRVEGKRFGQTLPELFASLVAERQRRLDLHALPTAADFLAQACLPQNQRDQLETVVLDQHSEEIGNQGARLRREDPVDAADLFLPPDHAGKEDFTQVGDLAQHVVDERA